MWWPLWLMLPCTWAWGRCYVKEACQALQKLSDLPIGSSQREWPLFFLLRFPALSTKFLISWWALFLTSFFPRLWSLKCLCSGLFQIFKNNCLLSISSSTLKLLITLSLFHCRVLLLNFTKDYPFLFQIFLHIFLTPRSSFKYTRKVDLSNLSLCHIQG